MSVSFENTATNRGVVTFTIGQDKIQPALDQAFNKVKKNLNVPGFRKGHIPRAVFNQKFGEEALYDDALNAILPAAYEAAIAELGLDVVKFFPAEAAGGLNMIKSMAAPYVNMKFMPTGGINAKNLTNYLDFNKIIACGGSWMVSKDLVAAKDWAGITALTKEAVSTMLGFKLLHVGVNNASEEAALVSIVYIGIMSVLYLIPQQIGNFSAYMLGVVAAFLVMYVQDRRNIYQKIFLAVTFFSIRWLAVAMADRLDDFITKALVFGNTIAGRQWLQYGLYAGTRILDIVLCIVFLAVAIGLINKAYVYKNDEMNVKELVMLIIPSLVGVTGYGILQYYLNIYEKDTGKSLTDTYGFYGALSFVHYFISIIAILVMTTMFQNWKVAQEEQTGQELVLNQVSDMKKHIGEVEKLYQDIRSLRHDMGNHIQMLEHLVAENHMDDAAEYMEHLKKEWNEISPEIKTGSPVIDVILMEKLREAKEKQIRFISDFHYPGDTKLNAFDLSVILNNALDNCMENVSGENPYICISSFRKNSIFMITIKNRYEGELNYKDSDLPETTKSGKEHGIGLHNIRRVARMYMGDIFLEQENQEVVLSIMLQVE